MCPIVLIPHFRHRIRRYWRLLGFTQLEVFVIIFIIGALATIALPSFNGMLQAAKAKQAAVEVRGAFQETQRQSIRGNATCRTDIDIPDASVAAPVIRGNCINAGEVKLPEGVTLVTNVLPTTAPTASRDRDDLQPWERPIHKAVFGDILNGIVDTACAIVPGLPFICPEQDGSLPSPSGSPVISSGDPSPSGSPTPSPLQNSGNGSSEFVSQPKEVSIQFGRLGSAQFQVAQDPSLGSTQDSSAKFVSVRPNNLKAKKPCVVLSGSLGLTRIGTYQGDLDPLSITREGLCQAEHWTQQK